MQGPGLLRRRKGLASDDFKGWMREVLAWRLYASLFWLVISVAVLLFIFFVAFWCSTAVLIPAGVLLVTLIAHHCSLRSIATADRQSNSLFIRVLSKPQLLLWLVLACAYGAFGQIALLGMLYSQFNFAAWQGDVVDTIAFAMFSGAFVGGAYAITLLREERNTMPFPSIQKSRIHRLKSAIGGIVARSVSFASLLIPILYVVHYSIRLIILARQSDRHQWWSTVSETWEQASSSKNGDLHLAFQLWVASVLMVLFWELSYQLLVVIHTQRLDFGKRATDQGGISRLREGLGQENSLMKYYAFLDLYTLSAFSQSRRAVIFADHTGEYWQALATRCCAVVDNCTARVETAISQADAENTKREKAWLRVLLSPSHLQKNQALFYDYPLFVWSVMGICKLCAASRQEDRYGVVQSSEGLQGILSSLLACLLAVERYCARPLPLPASLPHLDAHQLVAPHPHAVATVLHTGIYLLINTFYEDISSLSFPPKYAALLQSFVHFDK